MSDSLSPLEDAIYAFCRPKESDLSSLWPKMIMASGRHVRHIGIAVASLRDAEDAHVATYHATAGVVAGYAAIDALLVFFNFWCELGFEREGHDPKYPGLTWSEPSSRIKFGHDPFRKALETSVPPPVNQGVQALRDLEKEIAPYRHRALHRDGLRTHQRERSSGWYFYSDRFRHVYEDGVSPPMGQEYPTGEEPPVVDMLIDWADRLESTILSFLPQLTPKGSPESRVRPRP